MEKKIHIRYYAALREQRGCSAETIATEAENSHELYAQLCKRYSLSFSKDNLKVSINNEFRKWDTPLCDNDAIVFIPPVTGG